jgi:hypothetical protein
VVVHRSSAEEDPELEMNYLPVANVRTDPIISQTCLSDHVHTTVYGPTIPLTLHQILAKSAYLPVYFEHLARKRPWHKTFIHW